MCTIKNLLFTVLMLYGVCVLFGNNERIFFLSFTMQPIRQSLFSILKVAIIDGYFCSTCNKFGLFLMGLCKNVSNVITTRCLK